jgi:MATE family multidrug resistance protein
LIKAYLEEIKKLSKIGIPIFGTQLSYMLMGTTDTIIAGRASSLDLAGLGQGTIISNTLFFLFCGVIFSVTPIIAQLNGAMKFEEIGKKLREILWIAILLGILLMLILININPFINSIYDFLSLDIDKELQEIATSYLKVVAPGMAFLTIFTCLRCYSEGMALTLPVFVISASAMIINIPLDIIFVYGLFGAPKLGGVGCGIATSIVTFCSMIVMILYILFSPKYKKTKPFSEFTMPSKKTSIEVFKLGLPIGFGIFIELSMFSGAGLIIAVLGPKILASHLIAINIASLFFVVPLSIGLASATRVGNLVGEKNFLGAKFASFSAVYFCFFAAIINMFIILTFKTQLVSLYNNEDYVIALGASLLIFAALFQLPDGIQMGAAGSLRGYKDTFIPMILLLVSYWIFALPVGYYLSIGSKSAIGASGMWIAMIIGLCIFSLLAIARLKFVHKRYI